MRVCLIAPPLARIRGNISGVYPMPPLGLAYIASLLERHKFFVDILDMPALRINIGDLPTYLNRKDYDIFGISCNIFNLKDGIKISQIIKKLKPDKKIILGGPCTAFPQEEIFKYAPNIDIVVDGEGEEAMLNICTSLKNNKPLDNIGGIAYRQESSVIVNKKLDYLNLDDLPFPARHLLPNRIYGMHPPFGIYPPVTLIETSRGCAYSCTFCTLPKTVRTRSVDKVVWEIKDIKDRFKVREIHFVDPNFTYDQNRIMKLCDQLIEEDVKIAWTCKTRVDLVSRALLKKMSKAGCYMISYGVEAGSQKILDLLNKQININDIEDAFEFSREAKIRTIAYILLGSPWEDDFTVRETINLIKRIKPDFVLYGELLPDPNSAIVKQAVRQNKLRYSNLFDLYVFDEDIFIEKTLVGIPQKNIKKWLSMANRLFYFRPSYILKRLLRVKNIYDLFNLFRGVYYLFCDKIKISNNIYE